MREIELINIHYFYFNVYYVLSAQKLESKLKYLHWKVTLKYFYIYINFYRFVNIYFILFIFCICSFIYFILCNMLFLKVIKNIPMQNGYHVHGNNYYYNFQQDLSVNCWIL